MGGFLCHRGRIGDPEVSLNRTDIWKLMIVSEVWLGAVNGDQVARRKQQEQL
jgi:hypothetical protein